MSSRERYPEVVARDKASHPPELCSRFHQASELIGRRWTGAIIYVLMRTRCRFATLRDAIPDITDRMLSERLQELEQTGHRRADRHSGHASARRVRAQRQGPRAGVDDRRHLRMGGAVGDPPDRQLTGQTPQVGTDR